MPVVSGKELMNPFAYHKLNEIPEQPTVEYIETMIEKEFTEIYGFPIT